MSDFGFVKVAAVSPKVEVANPEANLNEAIKSIKMAEADGCQIVCLPELLVSAYSCGDLFFNSTLIKKCENALFDLLNFSCNSNTVIIIGLPVKVRGELFNCAAVLQSGEILGVVPKMYLSHSDGFNEKRHFEAGAYFKDTKINLCGKEVPFGNILFDVGNDITFGIEICEDLWVPISPSSSMALNGANIIFNLAASNEVLTKDEIRESLVCNQSSKCICAYIMASAGAGESTTDFVFSGDCLIAESGKILSRSDRFSQNSGYISACIDTHKLNALRRGSFSDNLRSCGIDTQYTRVNVVLPELSEIAVNQKYAPLPFVPDNELVRAKRCKDTLDIQCAGLAKRMTHTHINKLVIGISGGLDSTLALLVAHKTVKLLNLPEENVICVTMPGFGTTDRTYTNAVELIKATGATFCEIDIKAACIQHMRDIGHDIKIHDITYENTQARERTQILMDYANKEGALLVGTGDLSEMALGWCTYNGDHMSMYSVNAGVPKTLVRHIVKYVADNGDDKIAEVLLSVLDTPVSPELLPPDEQGQIAQKTEDKLGPYEVHDFYLYHFIRFGFTPEKLLFIASKAFDGVYTKEQLSDWLKLFLRRFFTNQFKRSCVPDGPKVGTIGLSPRGDWSMPSDADYSVWLENI
ncbi:MAG: NAD(+) synthase [Clostridia bacterium]|nr:NAD(+) synthase [Clostridia bacterium]